jgi:hypothetical protein
VALPPYPVNPAPITWTKEEIISTARLNADLANAALLLANRPLLVAAQSTTGQALAITTAVPIQLDTEYVDTWNGHQIPNPNYAVPLSGWYLAEGDVEVLPFAANSSTVTAGIQSVAGGTTTQNDGGRVFGNGVNNAGATCADLVQLTAPTDTIALYGECLGQAGTIAIAKGGAKLKTEWVAVPSAAGTVVTSPIAAAMWPPGSGTTITNSGGIAAGATSVTVTDATGMVVGGTLGLDWLNGLMTAATAETVTIASVSGTTIGISATLYSHAQTAPVAVPVSAAFLNQQVRDAIRFLSYPPIACVDNSGSAATLATQTFPASTPITFTRANVDNFGGWSTNKYTIPVAGVYYVFGQVFVAAGSSSFTLAAALQVNSGTAQWGTTTTNGSATARTMCATVRRHMRFAAGDVVQLVGNQNSGTSLSLSVATTSLSKLILVWRGF